jgi:hypothetical protein
MKDITKYSDLYGWELTTTILKRNFLFVSYRENSKPTLGSPTFKTKALISKADVEIKRAIKHRDKTITLVTNKGWFRFIEKC